MFGGAAPYLMARRADARWPAEVQRHARVVAVAQGATCWHRPQRMYRLLVRLCPPPRANWAAELRRISGAGH
jgi:hypothetical protein